MFGRFVIRIKKDNRCEKCFLKFITFCMCEWYGFMLGLVGFEFRILVFTYFRIKCFFLVFKD